MTGVVGRSSIIAASIGEIGDRSIGEVGEMGEIGDMLSSRLSNSSISVYEQDERSDYSSDSGSEVTCPTQTKLAMK